MSINKEIWKMRARLAAIIILAVIIGSSYTYAIIEGKKWFDWLSTGLAYANSTPYVSEVSAADPVGEKVFDKENGVVVSDSTPQSNLLEKYFGDEAKIAYAVMMAESSGDPLRIGDQHLAKPSIGLFQINQIWHPYTTEQLQDPEFNIKTAKEIRDTGGWERWSGYKNGSYLKFL